MQLDPVARVYAEALLGIARDRGVIDAIGAQLSAVAASVRDDETIRNFLETPTLDAEHKKRVLASSCRDLDPTLVDFLCLLVDKRRVEALDAIANGYQVLADEWARRLRVQATTAVPLPDDLRTRLEALLREKLQTECILETDVKPALIGGLVLRIDDTVYDGSVSRQLQRIGRQLTRSSGYED